MTTELKLEFYRGYTIKITKITFQSGQNDEYIARVYKNGQFIGGLESSARNKKDALDEAKIDIDNHIYKLKKNINITYGKG